MKKIYSLIVAAIAAMPVMAQTEGTATFDDFMNPTTGEALAAESYYNGETDQEGFFTSGNYIFTINNSWGGSSWAGTVASNRTAKTFDSSTLTPDQFNVCTGKGYNGSSTFGIYYPTTYNNTAGHSEQITSMMGDTFEAKGMYVNNTAYVVSSITKGDSYAKAFTKGSWLKFTAYGEQEDGTYKSVTFYLADYTSDDEASRYYIHDWTYVDLSSLGTVKNISFWPDGSDKSPYGLNTPTYFAMDNFGDDYDGTSPQSTGVAAGIDDTFAEKSLKAVEVARYTIDGQLISHPQKGLNIIRMSDGTTHKVIVK